jgi:ATP-dependent RNA helicase DDX35
MAEYAVKEGDLVTYLNVYNGFLDNRKSPTWCAQYGFNYRALCRVSEIR